MLWAALIINAVMFGIELTGGLRSNSVALIADAADFFSDATNYAISLVVLDMALAQRARAAVFKGVSIGALGTFVLAKTAWHAWSGPVPESATMGSIALLALVANLVVAIALFAWRDGDANMRSVWLCSRNDAIGNIAVLMGAVGVVGTGSRWPDLIVGAGLGLLALHTAQVVVRDGLAELEQGSSTMHVS